MQTPDIPPRVAQSLHHKTRVPPRSCAIYIGVQNYKSSKLIALPQTREPDARRSIQGGITQLKECHHLVSFSDMAPENNLLYINSLWGMVEDYFLNKKAKALHKKKFASVLSEIRAHYACNHKNDLEWFLNDLKTQEPELHCYTISFGYTYKTRGSLHILPCTIDIQTLLANGVFD